MNASDKCPSDKPGAGATAAALSSNRVPFSEALQFLIRNDLVMALSIIAPFSVTAVSFVEYIMIPVGDQPGTANALSRPETAARAVERTASSAVILPAGMLVFILILVAFVVMVVTAILISKLIERRMKGD